MEREKKSIFKKWWFWVLIVVVMLIAIGSGGNDDEKAPETTQEPIVEENAEPTLTEEPAPARENPLEYIDLSREEMRVAYNELDAALNESYTNGPAATASIEEIEQIENEIIQQVADVHGITAQEMEDIFAYALYGYLYDIDPTALDASLVELLDVTISGTTMVVKAKIPSSSTNGQVPLRAYTTVCDLICKQGCDVLDEIQFWAVADMTDGSESKVISFTVPGDVIKVVASEDPAMYYQTLGNYVEDLWLHPSLG